MVSFANRTWYYIVDETGKRYKRKHCCLWGELLGAEAYCKGLNKRSRVHKYKVKKQSGWEAE